MKKVVKFGGSSLASAQQFRKVGEIVRAEEDRKYVVPSAPGKRFNGDTKVTDMLYDCYQSAEDGEDFKGKLKNIKARYDEIISGLELSLSLDSEFKTIEENFKKHAGENYAASRGEYLNGIIMADYLGFAFIDSAKVIFFIWLQGKGYSLMMRKVILLCMKCRMTYGDIWQLLPSSASTI